MTEKTRETFRRGFWIVLAVVTALRLVLAGRFGLSVDEAHYVMYSRQLAWGYFDHPPMVGFLAALTGLVSESPFWMRLGPILCSAAAMILLRCLALTLYRDERVAFWAQVVLLLTPAYHLLGVALLPDATLNIFWCAALLAGWHAVREGKWVAWLLAGVAFGGALLSKYHGVLLPVCLFLFAVTSRDSRGWLARPQPYVAGLLGLLIFLPNIVWNAQHEWISYAFQLGHGGGTHFSLGRLVRVVGGQLAAAAPVMLGLLVAAWIAATRERPTRNEDRFLLWTSLPVFLFFCGMGLTGKILPHWTFVGWWAGAVLLAAVAVRRWEVGTSVAAHWRGWAVAGAAVSVVVLALTYAAILLPVVEPAYAWAREVSIRLHERIPAIPAMEAFKPGYDVTNDLYGWDEVGRKAEEMRHAMPQPDRTFVFCHRFHLTSLLALYLEPGTVPTSLRMKASQYQIWFRPEQYEGWDALFVDGDGEYKGPERYAALFERVEDTPVKILVFRKGRVAHAFRVYRCRGFAGRFERQNDGL